MTNKFPIAPSYDRRHELARNLSPAAQRSYLHAVTKFSRLFCAISRSPGLEDVRAFQVYLVSQGISWGSLNQIVRALCFFYGVTLDRAEVAPKLKGQRSMKESERIVRVFFKAVTTGELPDCLLTDDMPAWTTTQGQITKQTYQGIIRILHKISSVIDAVIVEEDRI